MLEMLTDESKFLHWEGVRPNPPISTYTNQAVFNPQLKILVI